MEYVEKEAKVSLYLDTRRKREKGLYPLRIRVYYNKARLYETGKWVSEDDFEKSYLAKKPKGEYVALKVSLQAIEAKANKVIKDLKVFTFEKFEKQLFRKKSGANNVIEYFEDYIDILDAEERAGTSAGYDSSLKSIKTFIGKDSKKEIKHISFDTITVDFLNKYEQWMISKDNSRTTVGIYLRNLRAVFNMAIEAGQVDRELYPFKKYRIPTGRNVKKALEAPDLHALFTAIPDDEFMAKARDFWFFSYQCNGMNFRDIAELKWKNVHNTYFSFLRFKTINTTKDNPSPIVVPITQFVEEFIKKYGNKKGKLNDYVFPIFQPGLSAKERLRLNQNFIRFVNQHMNRLAAQLKMDLHLGTMYARHSYTTKVVRAMGLEFAQEALGHTSMMTTQNYWKGFEQATKKQMAEKMLDFSDVMPKSAERVGA